MPFQQRAVGGESLKLVIEDWASNDSLTSKTVPISQTASETDPLAIKADTVSLNADSSEKGNNALKSKIKYHARDSMRVDIENEIVYLYGNATLDYEDLHLKSDYIMIDMHKKELFAEGATDSLGSVVGRPEF